AGRDHIQLVLTDRSAVTDREERGVIGTKTWRLGDLGSKHMLLKEGIGWGYMPEPMVRADLQEGRLVQLDLPEYKHGLIRMHAIHRTDTPPGPAGSWLIARFVTQAENIPLVGTQQRKRFARCATAGPPGRPLSRNFPGTDAFVATQHLAWVLTTVARRSCITRGAWCCSICVRTLECSFSAASSAWLV